MNEKTYTVELTTTQVEILVLAVAAFRMDNHDVLAAETTIALDDVVAHLMNVTIPGTGTEYLVAIQNDLMRREGL